MNQPQEKSKAIQILEDALGQHLKMQTLIMDRERDSALIARLPNPSGLPEYCSCSPDDMNPSNNAWREAEVGHERLCLNCDLWISHSHMDNYNRVFGYSGYDEEHDHDERFENE